MRNAVTWRALLLTSAASILLTLAIVAAVLILFPMLLLREVASHDGNSLRFNLPEKLPVRVTMPEGMQATVSNPVDIRMPLKSPVSVPIEKTFTTPVDISADVPINMTVHFEETIPVRQELPVDTRVEARLFGVWTEFPVRGTVPINLDVPVSVDIPVSKRVSVDFTTPVTVHLDESFSVPAGTTFQGDTRLLSPLDINTAPLVLGFEQQTLSIPFPWAWRSTGRLPEAETPASQGSHHDDGQ